MRAFHPPQTSSGYRIGPFEVESALKSHPAVLESAAVGSPDAARGEIVKAFITLSEEYAEKYKGKGKAEMDKLAVEIQVSRAFWTSQLAQRGVKLMRKCTRS